MPAGAYPAYLNAAFEYEMRRDCYFADMARYAAAANVKDPEKLPRYFDLVNPAKRVIGTADNGSSADVSPDDIIAAFMRV